MRKRVGLLVVLAWVLGAIIGVGGGYWAAQQTLVTPSTEQTLAAPQLFTVTDDHIGKELQLTAELTWQTEPLTKNRASGIVTSVDVADSRTVEPGDILYTVNLMPVVIAQGSIPAFRDLYQGLSGQDVLQLEEFLAQEGYFTGVPDTKFESATTVAVKQWQKALGQTQTGVVPIGAVLYVKELPMEVSVAPELRVDAALVGGEVLLSTVSEAVEGSIELDPQSREQAPNIGNRVVLQGPAGEIAAEIVDVVVDDFGTVRFVLGGADGQEFCAEGCEGFRASAVTSTVSAVVELQAKISGATVPLSAIGTDPLGHAHVLSAAGEEIAVEVLISAASRAIVSGVSAGDQIRLFAVEPVRAEDSSSSPGADDGDAGDEESGDAELPALDEQ